MQISRAVFLNLSRVQVRRISLCDNISFVSFKQSASTKYFALCPSEFMVDLIYAQITKNLFFQAASIRGCHVAAVLRIGSLFPNCWLGS